MDDTIIGGGVNLACRLEHEAPPGGIPIPYETYAHVRDEVHCEPRGEVRVRGLAYPVATCEVIDLHQNLDANRRPIQEERPHLRLDLDPGAMSDVDRNDAVALVRRALERLTGPL